MASCNTVLSGIALDCANTGGLQAVYIAPINDVQTVTSTEGVISAIAMVATKKFAKYSFRRGTSSLTKTATKDEAAGTSFVSSEVAMKFARMDAAKRKEMQELLNGNVYVIVKDNNGTNWFLGYNSYCSASAATGTSGTNRGEANEYTLNLIAETSEFPQTVDDATVTGVI